MTVFGIGTLELVVILLLMILIFGPERITEMARWLGQAYRKLTGLSSEVNQQVMDVRRAMDSTLDTAGITKSIREAANEVNSIQRDINKTVTEGTAAVKNLQTDVEKTIAETKSQLTTDDIIASEEPKAAAGELVAAGNDENPAEAEPRSEELVAALNDGAPPETESRPEELAAAVNNDDPPEAESRPEELLTAVNNDDPPEAESRSEELVAAIREDEPGEGDA
jgi:Sec-independent protein translocase protein TatA